jgi:hypothetical protein
MARFIARPVGVQLASELGRVGVLSDGRVRPDITHENCDLDALGLADPLGLPPELLGQPARQQPRQGLTLLFPVDDRLVQHPKPAQRALLARGDPGGQLDERCVHGGVDGGRRHALGCGNDLDRLALCDHAEQLLLGGQQAAGRDDRLDQRLDDRWVEGRAARGDAADGVGELAAFRDAVLEQVAVASRPLGEQRDRVLRVVVLGQHDDAGARVALADLLRRVDALTVERGWHPYIGDQHLGLGRCAAGDDLVVVGGQSDNAQVWARLDERAHA